MRTVEPPRNLELDHVFICTSDRGASLDALIAAGLSAGPRRDHHGQGTANDCFYFENAYLELLWMNDEVEIRSAAVKPLCLWERIHWRQTGACPFGIAFRPKAGFDLSELATWSYEAAYLPAGRSIPILSARDSAEQPLVFLSMNPLPPSSYGGTGRAHLSHRGRARRLTGVGHACDKEADLNALPSGERNKDASPLMVLELDDGVGEVSDLRPIVPMEIRW